MKVLDLGNTKTMKVKHDGEIDLEWYRTTLFITTGDKDGNGMAHLTKKQALKLASFLRLWATKGIKNKKPRTYNVKI